jgi:citrate lyase beta subunit
VGVDNKEKARETVLRVLQQFPVAPSERCVRINGLQTGLWRHDILAVLDAKPDAIMIPKAEDPTDLTRFCQELQTEEVNAGITPGATRLLLIIETAKGVLNSYEVALAAGQRLGAMLFGAEDLAADAGLIRTREGVEVLWARSRVSLTAAAAGVTAIDQVYVDINDVAGCEAEARYARILGYTGKMAIHPNQLPPIHRAFTPQAADVERAVRLLQAAETAQGAFQFEGRMIDAPLIEQARRVVKSAQRAAALAKHGL